MTQPKLTDVIASIASETQIWKSRFNLATVGHVISYIMAFLLTPPSLMMLAAASALVVVGSMAAPSEAYTLFGNVSHSDVLPPVKKNYPIVPLWWQKPNQGAVEKSTRLAPEYPSLGKPAVVWIPVPKWLAGKWIKQGDLTVSYADLRTGVTKPVSEWTQNLQTVTWGNQIDGQGNVWQGYSIPTEWDSISNGKFVRFILLNGQIEPSSPDHMVTRTHFIVTESLGTQVVEAFQQESLNDLFLLPSRELENHGSTKDFTNEGQPIRKGMLISRFTKVGSFEPIEIQDGVDLLKSLNDYLRAHNMSQLIRHGP